MRRVLLLIAASLAGCQSVSNVQPVGPETYTVSSEMSGQFPSWSDVKGLAIKRANEFCAPKGKVMEVVGWETHGARGWTPLNAELTFKCVQNTTQ